MVIRHARLRPAVALEVAVAPADGSVPSIQNASLYAITPLAVTADEVDGLKATFDSEAYQDFNEQNSLTPMEIPGHEVLAQLSEDKQRHAELIRQNAIDLREAGLRPAPRAGDRDPRSA
ncbi:hypothetical protein L2K20_25770 [Mycobacterium sp. MBM]|nr:hypothetical protein [Mycobacterium sp. MBM]